MSTGEAMVILVAAVVLTGGLVVASSVLVKRLGAVTNGTTALGSRASAAPLAPAAPAAPDAVEQRAEIVRLEERLMAREDKLELRTTELGERERQLAEREVAVEKLRSERIRALESVAGLAASQARTMLLKELEE